MILKTIIDLDNNYYLEIITNTIDLPADGIDIENLKLINILKEKRLLLKVNFNNFSKKQYKKLLKRLLFIKKIISKSKTKIGKSEDLKILLGYIINYDENNKEQNDFVLAINAIIAYNTRYKQYRYIYDTVCNYLDGHFYGKNVCDFKDNHCPVTANTSTITGCCKHFKYRWLGPLSKLVVCEHLNKDYTCGVKCIGCKLYTCHYLEKKGIKFRIKDFLLLDAFFNPLQKYVIKYMVYTPRDKVIKRLMKISFFS